MIYVERGPEPVGFSSRSAEWQRRFEEAKRQNPTLSPATFWGQVRKEIQPDAQVMGTVFHSKCAFCESKMEHVANAQIEHYRPKSKFPDRMFAWDNWLLSCGRCNEKKWAHFPECDGQPCLLNPTSEDPHNHLDFWGAQIQAKTKRGEKTITLIGLDRYPLEEERKRWLMYIENLLLLACCVPEAHAEARELLIWAMQADAPYSAMVRAYLYRRTPRLARPDTPHPIVEPNDPMRRIRNLIKRHSAQLETLV